MLLRRYRKGVIVGAQIDLAIYFAFNCLYFYFIFFAIAKLIVHIIKVVRPF